MGALRAKRATTTNGRKRVVLYVRVSTADQADRGVSLDAQRERLTAWAVAADVEVVAVEEDAGISAATLARPGLQRALDLLRRGRADVLVVVSLSRLTRSVRDLVGLLEERFAADGAGLVSLSENVDTTSPTGKLLLHLLGAVAEWERAAAAERTRAALAHIRQQGRKTGGAVPYGYAVATGGRLVPVEAEQAVIRRARALRDAGLTLAAAADRLTAEGHRARNGRPFVGEQVRRMTRAEEDTAA